MKFPEQESSTLEWKGTFPKHDQIVKTLIAFCNRNGGKIVIGVDNEGNIVGVDEEKIQISLEYIDKMIYESSSPPIIPQVYSQRFGNRLVLIIEVSMGMNKPYYFTSEGLQKGTYIRLGRNTVRADAEIIEELKWTSHGKSFDMMPVYAGKEQDVYLELVKQFLKTKGAYKSISKQLLHSYHLLIEEHMRAYPTTAGILLFGQPQKYFPEAFIICSHFSGISGREAIATKDCTGNLFEQFEAAFEFIFNRLNKSFIIENKKRKEKLEIPSIAIREMLLNAIVHRNYYIKAPIKIAIYENRLEIFSPGDFPGPINSTNLLMGLTYIRNTAICKVFREAGYIEKLGSGFTTLFQSYEEYGLSPPQVIEGENFIKCVLPRTHSTTEKNDEQKILALFERTSEITISDVIDVLHLKRATAGRRLTELVEKGLIVKIGHGRGSSYTKA